MTVPVRQDTELPFWTLDQAALHFGSTRRTIRRYITDGLPTYFAGTMVKPGEVIDEMLDRQRRTKQTRSQ